MTVAKVYGLTENPFEPTGAAVGKYPFVAPENFSILEEKIKEAGIEKKFYALLVNSPHGAGKSTTMEYLKEKAVGGGYLSYRAPVILTKLSTLSIADFVQDVLREASKYGDIKFTREPKHAIPTSVYREMLVNALSPIAARSKLMLWIVDEFDILADRPKEEQQTFLQFLRGVVDGFAAKDVPIAFIMSHTKYSSREFERHLSEQHEPFRSRIVASVPLAYSFDEVKQIVFSRLKKASTAARQEGDLSPFSQEALKSLYELILSVRGTDRLDNFRVLERVCHFALIEGAKRELREIDSKLITELFKEYGMKEISLKEPRHLSLKTSQEIAELKSKSLMERNEAISRGIIVGISKSIVLGRENELRNVQTAYVGPVGKGNIVVGSLSFSLIHRERPVNILCFLASNKAEIIQTGDLEQVIQMISSRTKEHETYANIKLLCFVSSVDVLKIPTHPFNRVFRLSDGTAEDLIGLSIGDEKEIETLAKSFDVEIAPLLSQVIERETRDITTSLSASSLEAAQTLFIMSALRQGCTKETLRQYNKKLFMRGNLISEKPIREAIQSGFIQETAGQLEPSIPKAHQFLFNLLREEPQEEEELLRILGIAGEAILASAETLHMVRREANRVTRREISDFQNELAPQINYLRQMNEDETIRQSALGEIIGCLVKSYDNSETSEFPYSRYVILSAIEKLKPKIEDEIDKLAKEPAGKITVAASGQKSATMESEETGEKAAGTAESTQVQSETVAGIENAILQAVRDSGSMSIQEIDNSMKQIGYEQDIKRTVLRLVLEGKLKVVSAG